MDLLRCLGIALVCAPFLAGAACTPAADGLANEGTSGDPHDGSGGTDQPDPTGPGGGGQGGEPTPAVLGMVVIDVQETFVDFGANDDMPGVLNRTANAFQLATDHELPFLLTFEASTQGDHALHAPLSPAVPEHGQQFVKTTFAATGLPAFRDAVEAAQLTHVVVLGAETDVCVLQTVLGLRSMGLSVLLQTDAVFSSERNVPPALRRMAQAGVVLVDESEVAAFAAAPEQLPAIPESAPTIVVPLDIGVVLNGFTNATVNASNDPLKAQKTARLRELLLVSEWFDRPVYVNDVSAGLPSALASSYQGQLLPLSQLAQDGAVRQIVVAGTDAQLTMSMPAWMSSHHVFVMEDALLATTTMLPEEQLTPFYAQGLVPLTYKTYWYEMTQSVDENQWPSQAWVDKFDEFYWITSAPEDLPPIEP